MDVREAKLALARKKLKSHQEKKNFSHQDSYDEIDKAMKMTSNENDSLPINQSHIKNDSVNDPLVNVNDSEINAGHVNALPRESDINVTEILISNKRSLELQVTELQSKLSQVENNYASLLYNYTISQQKIVQMENELKLNQENFTKCMEEIKCKEKAIGDLTNINSSLVDENCNYREQLEFTKTILTSKETESASLHSQLFNIQNQLEAKQLQLQQLMNGSSGYMPTNVQGTDKEQNEALLQKISALEQQLKLLQKERDQINSHYDHYVTELNKQLRSLEIKNEDQAKELQALSNRENSLIEQISDMEIRIQNYNKRSYELSNFKDDDGATNEIKKKYEKVKDELDAVNMKCKKLHEELLETNARLEEVTEKAKNKKDHDAISVSKLNADITSDKVAAQRATEQNKKLKEDLQELEKAFVKMSKDKLELTEKLTAEKYLNRELTIKLADIDDKAKNMQVKLKAKDEEMIRLQSKYREIEQEIEKSQQIETVNDNAIFNEDEAKIQAKDIVEDGSKSSCKHSNDSVIIPSKDAMVKLQDRFLKIMEEVADLSDEKHRLEHIILQLQTETDTICEYVALYQQQRSLLKKRDEERSTQMKIFQSECDRLKKQLEELNDILIRFAEDKELFSYFQTEDKRYEMEKVKQLLSNLKHNSLVDPIKKSLEFKNFYPCSCCSGQLIEI